MKINIGGLKEKVARIKELKAQVTKPNERFKAVFEVLEQAASSAGTTHQAKKLRIDPATGRLISGGDQWVAAINQKFKLSPGSRGHQEGERLQALFEELESLAKVTAPASFEIARLESELAAEMQPIIAHLEQHFMGKRAEMLAEIEAKLLPYCRDRKEAAEAADLCSGPRDLFGRCRSYKNLSPFVCAQTVIRETERGEI